MLSYASTRWKLMHDTVSRTQSFRLQIPPWSITIPRELFFIFIGDTSRTRRAVRCDETSVSTAMRSRKKDKTRGDVFNVILYLRRAFFTGFIFWNECSPPVCPKRRTPHKKFSFGWLPRESSIVDDSRLEPKEGYKAIDALHMVVVPNALSLSLSLSISDSRGLRLPRWHSLTPIHHRWRLDHHQHNMRMF